jgi:ABC-type multidrug transport system fused ATPase/permease subunit
MFAEARTRIFLASVVALFVIAAQYMPHFTRLIVLINRMIFQINSLDALEAILQPDAPSARNPSAGHPVTGFREALELRSVCMDYRPRSEFEIRDLSFTLRKGTATLLCGSSGSGKSTAVDLILGVLEARSGSVVADGIALPELSLSSWRERVAVAGQNTGFLAHRTIRENIAYGADGATEQTITRAAEAAGAVPFIESLPQRYDTPVRENGMNFSGGQRQRLQIARALAVNPEILILDEATSGLDKESEARIVRHLLGRVRSGLTLLLITHSLDHAPIMDQILVMEDGRLVERGTHEKLLSAGGAYATATRMKICTVSRK